MSASSSVERITLGVGLGIGDHLAIAVQTLPSHRTVHALDTGAEALSDLLDLQFLREQFCNFGVERRPVKLPVSPLTFHMNFLSALEKGSSKLPFIVEQEDRRQKESPNRSQLGPSCLPLKLLNVL